MRLSRDLLRKLPLVLRVEIEENALHKPLTQSELARLQRDLLAELRGHATPGERTDLRAATPAKGFAQVEAKRATSIVGKLFGESYRQVEKRLAVLDAAQAEPERYGRLLEDMDRTGRVDRTYRELRQRQARAAGYEARIKQGCTIDDLSALAASGKRFAVIYADVPLSYTVHCGAVAGGGAERHYDVMTVDELKAMGSVVQSLAARDCALFFWATYPNMPAALDIIAAWGFEYVTAAFTWLKTTKNAECITLDGKGLHVGNGWLTRPNTEVVLYARRGSPRRLAADVRQVVIAPIAEHSAKPEEVRRRIERLFAGSYLELFGRRVVPGWTVFGNEVPREQFLEAAE